MSTDCLEEVKSFCTFDNCFGSVDLFLKKNPLMAQMLLSIVKNSNEILNMNKTEITVERFITPHKKGIYIHGHTSHFQATEVFKQFKDAVNDILTPELRDLFIIDFVPKRRAKNNV